MYVFLFVLLLSIFSLCPKHLMKKQYPRRLSLSGGKCIRDEI